MKVLLVGFGDIAGHLAPYLIDQGVQVTGLRRTTVAVEGVEMLAGDCCDQQTLRTAMGGNTAVGNTTVIVTLTPSEFTEQAYQECYVKAAKTFKAVLATMDKPPLHLFWVSSTRVYEQQNGEWVDETSVVEPASFSGRCLLEAETIISECPLPVTIIRFSGIYGPGRNRLITQVRKGHCVLPASILWTNRIHRNDCASVLQHLLNRLIEGKLLAPLYLATDCLPVALQRVQKWLAHQLGVTLPEADPAANRGSKRCSNQRLLESGFEFEFPTYREGYASMLNKTAVDHTQ